MLQCMAEIVNLNKARKRRDKAVAERRAEENRAAFGRTAQERAVEEQRREALRKLLDGARKE